MSKEDNYSSSSRSFRPRTSQQYSLYMLRQFLCKLHKDSSIVNIVLRLSNSRLYKKYSQWMYHLYRLRKSNSSYNTSRYQLDSYIDL